MISIAIVNRKGGTGKTTTALAMASGLVRKRKKVLAIDLDPQCNFSTVSRTEKDVIGVRELLMRAKGITIEDAIQHREGSYDLICADPLLSAADKQLNQLGAEEELRYALGKLTSHYDYIVVDTPPHQGILTLNALIAADEVIMAVHADSFSTAGIMGIYQNIEAVRERRNAGLRIAGILVCRFNGRTQHGKFQLKQLRKLADAMQTKVYAATIRENVALEEAATAKESIWEYDAASHGAEDYDAFLKEFLEGRDGKP